MDSAHGPSLDFEWELALFRGARTLWQRLRGGGGTMDPARAATVEPEARALSVLAQFVAGVPLRLCIGGGDGGMHGGGAGGSIVLPRAIDALATTEENATMLRARVVLVAAMLRQPPAVLPADRLARAEVEAARVRVAAAWLAEELPGFVPVLREVAAAVLAVRPAPRPRSTEERVEQVRRALLVELAGAEPAAAAGETSSRARPVPLWGELLDHVEGAVDVGAPPSDARTPQAPRAEKQAPRVGAIERAAIDEKEREEAVLMHTFEKIETADEHRGGARDVDGGDELDDHLEALEEVELGRVVRTGDEAASLLVADTALDAGLPDVASIAPHERGVAYDEWDARARRYRAAWCTVYPTPLRGQDEAWCARALSRRRGLVDEVVRRITEVRARLESARRQRDGDRIDLDAVVDHLAAARAGHAGAPRLYRRTRRSAHALATTVLLDLSMSTDAWIDGRRVLDVSREAVLVLGEVAFRLGDDLEVLGFASHTRNRCRVFEIRRASEPWRVGRARLGALRPQGYTRIGPALRHAVAQIASRDARARLVVLVTDGRPTDYDRYEGRYGIEDVRQAVREAERRGVHVHALTIDEGARNELPAMVGIGRWSVVPRVEELPRALASVYARLTG